MFLSWTCPSADDQNACLNKSNTLNYNDNYIGLTSKPASLIKQDKELSQNGFSVNHSRILVGSGLDTFERGKTALQNWRHFGLKWAFVDEKTPIKSGVKFCVCVKEMLPWLIMPLQMVYVNDVRKRSFSFGSGTLQGHLLAGEERFSITMDDQDQVWYEIVSFSKPAHLISTVGYPYVLLKQKIFAHHSSKALSKYLSSNR